jgi:hypothetical protein
VAVQEVPEHTVVNSEVLTGAVLSAPELDPK